MAREAATYRAARRNFCKQERMVWGSNWYYSMHRATYHRATQLHRAPSKYHPLADVKEGYAKFAAKVAGALAGASSLVSPPKTRSAGRGR